MFGIGGFELLIILLFAFLIFGPEKLPQAGRVIGRAIRQFRNAQEEMNRVIREEVYDPFADDEPLENPFEGVFGDASDTSDTSDTPVPPDSAKVTPAETFAERKARLALEREQARLAEAETGRHGTTEKDGADDGGTPVDSDVDGKGGERGA